MTQLVYFIRLLCFSLILGFIHNLGGGVEHLALTVICLVLANFLSYSEGRVDELVRKKIKKLAEDEQELTPIQRAWREKWKKEERD